MLNIDILNIDEKIKQEFKIHIDNIPIYKQKLEYLNKSKLEIGLSSSIYADIDDNIIQLTPLINDSEKNLNYYLNDTLSILQQYKVVLNTPLKLNFLGKNNYKEDEKNELIRTFLKISHKYIDTYIENNKNGNKIICNHCNNKKLFDVIENYIYICLICGSQQEIILHTSSYKDIDRINITNKFQYDRKIHFRDCINQYQGKQNCTIDKTIYVKLIDQFKKHHLLEKSTNGKKEDECCNIKKEHIYIFLKELGYNKHYENVNLIHYQITGIKPDDISYLEDKLLEDFDILTDLYDKKFKNKPGFERKNFINTQYVLYQLLLKYKHPCNKENFTILKTVERKSFHDDVTKICFEELGWNHQSIF